MFTIRIARLNIGIDHHFPFVYRQCAGYYTDEAPDFTVSATLEEIEKEWEISTEEVRSTVKDAQGYCESVVLYRKLCLRLPEYDALLFHGAAVAYKDRTYIFSAPSGTGKTTHLKLWREAHRPELTIINGDKPILRKEGDTFRVFGTPWAGKEGWQGNNSALIGALCFIDRSPTNSIERLSSSDAASRAMKQILFPKDPQDLLRTLQLTDELVRGTPVYLLHCNISAEAGELSFRTLTKHSPEPEE